MATSHSVTHKTFTITKFRDGYDLNAVDDYLDAIGATLLHYETHGVRAGDSLAAEDVVSARFPVTKFRDGYDLEQVDNFLDEVARSLRAWETGQPQPDEAPESAESPRAEKTPWWRGRA